MNRTKKRLRKQKYRFSLKKLVGNILTLLILFNLFYPTLKCAEANFKVEVKNPTQNLQNNIKKVSPLKEIKTPLKPLKILPNKPPTNTTTATKEVKVSARSSKNSDFKGLKYNDIVSKYAKQYKVDVELIHAVIRTESRYNRLAVSRSGAQGVMQLMPMTAKSFGCSNPFNVDCNIHAGVKYLADLQSTFKDTRAVIAGYNAGEGNVLKYGGVPPFRETRNYVSKVCSLYKKCKSPR